jgi:hypothetical protein
VCACAYACVCARTFERERRRTCLQTVISSCRRAFANSTQGDSIYVDGALCCESQATSSDSGNTAVATVLLDACKRESACPGHDVLFAGLVVWGGILGRW